MGAVASMKEKLLPLHVYTLQESSTVYKELCAYAAALDSLETVLIQAERECFIQTAQTYGLENREINIGPVRGDLQAAQRREMLLKRMSLTSGDFNLEGARKMLASLGLVSEIYELPQQQVLHIDCQGSYTAAQRKWIAAQATGQLPAHLEVLLDFRKLQWSVIDEKNLSFAAMDAKGLSWRQIESYGV